MTPAATVAASIVSGLAVPPAGQAAALAAWTIIVTQIQAMVLTGTINVTGLATGVLSGAATAPVVATGTIT